MTGTSSATALGGLRGVDFAAGLAGSAFADPASPALMALTTGLSDAAALLVALANLSALGISGPSNSRLSYRQPTMFRSAAIRSVGTEFIFWLMQLVGATTLFLARRLHVTK